MSALSPAIRSGPAVAVLLALALAVPAMARDANASHHYSISGSLTRASAPVQGGPLRCSRTSRNRDLVEQSGDRFVMNARLAEQPLGCGSDKIFANGFDP